MYRYQQKGQNFQELNFELSELIQAVSNYKIKDVTDPLEIYMSAQKLCNPTISAKTT